MVDIFSIAGWKLLFLLAVRQFVLAYASRTHVNARGLDIFSIHDIAQIESANPFPPFSPPAGYIYVSPPLVSSPLLLLFVIVFSYERTLLFRVASTRRQLVSSYYAILQVGFVAPLIISYLLFWQSVKIYNFADFQRHSWVCNVKYHRKVNINKRWREDGKFLFSEYIVLRVGVFAFILYKHLCYTSYIMHRKHWFSLYRIPEIYISVPNIFRKHCRRNN